MILRDKKGRFVKGSRYNHTEDSKRKISEAHKGIIFSEEHKKKLSISKANISNETREKMSLGQKIRFKNMKHSMLGKHHSEESKLKMRTAKLGKIGELANNWRGGIGPLNRKLRACALYQIWRSAVFLRDNFTCQNFCCKYCKNKIGVMIHPHHIKPVSLFPELAFKIDNGTTYCKEFHINSGLHKNMQGVQNFTSI